LFFGLAGIIKEAGLFGFSCHELSKKFIKSGILHNFLEF